MPRVKRRKKIERSGWNEVHRDQLTHGITVASSRGFGPIHKGPPVADFVAMERAWWDLRDELIEAWVAEHPFTRPLGFWQFEAKEPRIRVTGEAELAEAAANTRDVRHPHRASFRLCFFESLNARLGAEETRHTGDDWESEKQWLIRNDALTASEVESLAK